MDTWRKSTYSGSNGGDCIEVAASGEILVRDTKDRDGATLGFSAQAWEKFITSVK